MAAKRAAEEAERAPATGDGDVPDALYARSSRHVGRKVAIGVGVLALILWIGLSRRVDPPPLAASCTRPAFALSAVEVRQARPVAFTIVGPDDKRYVLGVNTTGYVHNDDGTPGYHAVPVPGREDQVLVPRVDPLKKCRETGVFALPFPPGQHTVTLYELAGGNAVEVQKQTVTVIEP